MGPRPKPRDEGAGIRRHLQALLRGRRGHMSSASLPQTAIHCLPPPGHPRDPVALSLPDTVIILVKINKPKPGVHHGTASHRYVLEACCNSRGKTLRPHVFDAGSVRDEPITEWCSQHPKPNIEGPQIPRALLSPLSILRRCCRSYGDSRGSGTHFSGHLSKWTHRYHVKGSRAHRRGYLGRVQLSFT